MTAKAPLRRIRLGMVGGGSGAFIGAVHRIAARLDGHYELLAGALSSDPERARSAALELGIALDRAYGSFAEMVEAETSRPDRIDAVAIVTPNYRHHAPAKAFLEAGIHVICDKPLTTTLADALDLAEAVRRTGLVFGLTHNYTGYPMVRQARAMVASGELGRLRVVQVEYAQDWLTVPLEETGQKQAAWRTDPAQSGPAGCLGDIGTHAYNIVRFVTGLSCDAVATELTTFVAGRRLDDNVSMLLRLSDGARGMLWASQVAPGNDNNLRLRVYGEKAGLDWRQEDPNTLWLSPHGEPPRLIRRGARVPTPLLPMRAAFRRDIPKAILRGSRSFTSISQSRLPPAAMAVPPTPPHFWCRGSMTGWRACASSPPPSSLRATTRHGWRCR